MYSNKILEIFKNPANAGGLQGANGLGKYIDEECGDCVKLYLRIDEREEIDEARFKTMGSVGTIVASSAVCQAIIGMNLEEAQAVTKDEITIITGKYPEDKEYTIGFALKALALAIEDYKERVAKGENKPFVKKERAPKASKKAAKVQDEEIIEAEETAIKEEVVVNEAMQNLAKLEAEGLISEEENNKASNMVEGAKSYTPVVATKILSDEDIKMLEAKRDANKPKEDKKISSAKAMFDAMFEE